MHSFSEDSFGAYIDVLKLLLSASSLQLGRHFFLANSLLYRFAQKVKPFEIETQFIEAVELHDELYELVLKTEGLDREYWKYSPEDPAPALDLVFKHHASFFSLPSQYEFSSILIIF